jgi:hypothetical protein
MFAMVFIGTFSPSTTATAASIHDRAFQILYSRITNSRHLKDIASPRHFVLFLILLSLSLYIRPN